MQAWKKASADLQISVEAPFIVPTDKGEIEFPILIKHFGWVKGTIIFDMNEYHELPDIPELSGYCCSSLNPEVYGEYDREEFIDTLEDWGYFGESESKPAWYEGKYYKEEKQDS